MEKAIDWWDNLSNIECIGLERKYGFYGHDIGVTEDDILFMYEEELVVKS